MARKEVPLGKSSVSKNFQTYIITEARPYLQDLKPGDFIEFVFDISNGKLYIRKAKK